MPKFKKAFVADTSTRTDSATEGRTDVVCSYVFRFCRFLEKVEVFGQRHISLSKQKSSEFLAGSLENLRRKQVKNIGEQSRNL